MSSRRCAVKRACAAGGIPRYAADLITTRGRCMHGRCRGRWAVTRVSLDFSGERVDRLATLECASCGRVWRRVRAPALRSAAGYQAVRLTLILPGGDFRRWHSRGRWKVSGTSGVVLRDADLGDLDEAARAHTKRADGIIDARVRNREREAAKGAVVMARIAALESTAAARRAEREADEAAAAAREGMMAP